jgi:hypothetical protein
VGEGTLILGELGPRPPQHRAAPAPDARARAASVANPTQPRGGASPLVRSGVQAVCAGRAGRRSGGMGEWRGKEGGRRRWWEQTPSPSHALGRRCPDPPPPLRSPPAPIQRRCYDPPPTAAALIHRRHPPARSLHPASQLAYGRSTTVALRAKN